MLYLVEIIEVLNCRICNENSRSISSIPSYMNKSLSITHNLVSCHIEIPLMQFSYSKVQEKYLQKKKNIYFAFINLENAFNHVPQRILWWVMWKLRIDYSNC